MLKGNYATRAFVLGDYALVIDGLFVTNFYTAGNCAAFYCDYTTKPLIQNCVVMGNRAAQSCGCGWWGTYKNCIIANNAASWTSAGLRSSVAYNCLIYNNSCPADVAGAENTLLVNCTVVSNNNGGVTGGVCSNTIIYGNAGYQYTNLYGGISLSWSCATPLAPGPGNIDKDPLFVDFAKSDFRLKDDSPCVNAGTNMPWMGDATDLDGKPRILNGSVDMGAYESSTISVSITTSVFWICYDTSAIALAGTECNASGFMCVSNAANGEICSFAAAPFWQSPQIPLAVGPNTISAYATNAYGNMTNASVTITRGGIGTGAPFVDITNATPPVLSYDVTSFTIGITNNVHVVGWVLWTNLLTGFSCSTPVSSFESQVSSIPLGVGANPITVTGTNALNVSASDTITITRGGNGTGAPFVDITNVLAGPVNNAVSTFTVAGTNNLQVVGTMWWVNAADGSRSTFGASPSWKAAVPLVVGLNTITVYGTNLWTVQTNDPINVMRLPGAPASVRATDGTFTNIVRVTFAASVNATKYMVCRAPASTPTNFAALPGEITATSFDDATVAAGQQYYYAVQAGSPYGWSALSASDSGFALFAINAGEWKYKAGAKVNKKGKMTGKDVLKAIDVNPVLMPYFAQGWRIGLAGLVQGALTNWNGPYSLTPNKSQKLWQVKDPAKGTPKVCFIKYSVNDKKGDKLDYQLWTNMPTDKVLYILPTNLLFSTGTLLNEQGSSEPPVQFRLQPAGKADKQGWQPLDATVIGVQ
ncbi:MAG: hypothetical protein NTV22_15935 [bacterium]|nr:hypothetical protein [bacterium]